MRRFCVVSTVMGNDEKCLLLRVVLSQVYPQGKLYPRKEKEEKEGKRRKRERNDKSISARRVYM